MDKGVASIAGLTLLILGGVLVVASRTPQQRLTTSFEGSDEQVISQEGVHWHPQLTILIKGQRQEIPANIGIGEQYRDNRFYDPMMNMTDIHTHDASGTLHWEVMEGPVKQGHARLGALFEVWGKPFSPTQLLDYTNGAAGTVRMTVNGQPNTEFDQYLVRDGDAITLTFE